MHNCIRMQKNILTTLLLESRFFFGMPPQSQGAERMKNSKTLLMIKRNMRRTLLNLFFSVVMKVKDLLISGVG